MSDRRATDDDAVRRSLRGFVLTSFLPGEDPDTLGDDDRLVSSGVIPSLSLLELVVFVEQTFGVTLEADDVGAERMDSIDKLVELVAERAGRDTDGIRARA